MIYAVKNHWLWQKSFKTGEWKQTNTDVLDMAFNYCRNSPNRERLLSCFIISRNTPLSTKLCKYELKTIKCNEPSLKHDIEIALRILSGRIVYLDGEIYKSDIIAE